MIRMVSQPPGLGQHLASKIEQLIGSRGVRAGIGSPPWKNGGRRPATAAPPSARQSTSSPNAASVEVRPGRGGGLFVAQASPEVRLRQTLLTVSQGVTTIADGIAVRDALDGLIALSGASPRSRQSRGRWCYAIPRRATDAGRQLGSGRVLTMKSAVTPAAGMVLS